MNFYLPKNFVIVSHCVVIALSSVAAIEAKAAPHKRHKKSNAKIRHYNNARAVHPIYYPHTNFLHYGRRPDPMPQVPVVNPLPAAVKEKQSKPAVKKESGKKHAKESEKKQEKIQEKSGEKSAEKKDSSPEKKDKIEKPVKISAIPAITGSTSGSSLIEEIANSKPTPVAPAGIEANTKPGLPSFNIPGLNVSPVTLVLFLGLAAFWIGMILRALCGYKGKGMRSRLAEDED